MSDILLFLTVFIFVIVITYVYWRFFFFFRDPERVIPEGRDIVSPADGTIVYIKKIEGDEVPISIKKRRLIRLEEIFKQTSDLPKNSYLIGIFMHPNSVHVNRAPISGRVENVTYTTGKNHPMTMMWWRIILGMRPYESHSDHILQNERNVILFKGEISLFIVQIADIFVNKIECWVKEGDEVKKGQRVGMIKMGSQVDVLFSVSDISSILVNIGQKVKAGETILASLK